LGGLDHTTKRRKKGGQTGGGAERQLKCVSHGRTPWGKVAIKGRVELVHLFLCRGGVRAAEHVVKPRSKKTGEDNVEKGGGQKGLPPWQTTTAKRTVRTGTEIEERGDS